MLWCRKREGVAYRGGGVARSGYLLSVWCCGVGKERVLRGVVREMKGMVEYCGVGKGRGVWRCCAMVLWRCCVMVLWWCRKGQSGFVS